MNAERLDMLAADLEAMARKPKHVDSFKFDLVTWLLVPKALLGKKKLLTCGTQACAVGTAMLSKRFQKMGLGYEETNWLGPAIAQMIPTYEGFSGWPAVTEFFDLDSGDAERLFSKDEYTHTKGKAGMRAVAERIREYIAENIQAEENSDDLEDALEDTYED